MCVTRLTALCERLVEKLRRSTTGRGREISERDFFLKTKYRIATGCSRSHASGFCFLSTKTAFKRERERERNEKIPLRQNSQLSRDSLIDSLGAATQFPVRFRSLVRDELLISACAQQPTAVARSGYSSSGAKRWEGGVSASKFDGPCG